VNEFLTSLAVRAAIARDRALVNARDQRGQGTVEYVGLILLVSMLMVGMVAAMKGFNGTSGTEIAEVIISKIKQAVNAITFR
jgi:Flp pilus assembly pilin Flp